MKLHVISISPQTSSYLQPRPSFDQYNHKFTILGQVKILKDSLISPLILTFHASWSTPWRGNFSLRGDTIENTSLKGCDNSLSPLLYVTFWDLRSINLESYIFIKTSSAIKYIELDIQNIEAPLMDDPII